MRHFKHILPLLFFIHTGIQHAQNLDVDILRSIHSTKSLKFDPAMNLTSSSIYVIMPLSCVGTLGHGYYKKDSMLCRNGLRSGASLMIAGGIASILKLSIQRDRPFVAYPLYFKQKDMGIGPHSFPSGHTTFAFASATNLSLTYKKWYVAVPAYAYASVIAYSRLYLGVHYPSDVLAGAMIGIGSGFLVWKVDEYFLRKMKSKQHKVAIRD